MRLFPALFLAVLLLGCSKDSDNPITNPSPTVYEPNGAWVYSGTALTYNPGTCGFGSNPMASVGGTFIVARVGSNISAETNGITYTGTFSNNVISMTATYLNNGWIEADIVSFGLSSNTEGTGSFAWSMTAGSLTCSGTNSLTATKS
jgi:hypothetical protein